LHNLGPIARFWLAIVVFDIFISGKIPKNWKIAINIIALPKPRKITGSFTKYFLKTHGENYS